MLTVFTLDTILHIVDVSGTWYTSGLLGTGLAH